MDWTADERGQIKAALDAAGIGVSEIGSPIGKTPIDEPFEKTQAALAHGVELAKFFGTPNIRMFSFYPPAAGDKAGWEKKYRDEVLRRLTAMAEQVASEPIVLMLENEAELYGDGPQLCLDIMTNVPLAEVRAGVRLRQLRVAQAAEGLRGVLAAVAEFCAAHPHQGLRARGADRVPGGRGHRRDSPDSGRPGSGELRRLPHA